MKNEPVPDQIVYNTRQAAQMLGLSVSALAGYRKNGKGPRFQVHGKGGRGSNAYYLREHLELWAKSRPSYQSLNEFDDERNSDNQKEAS